MSTHSNVMEKILSLQQGNCLSRIIADRSTNLIGDTIPYMCIASKHLLPNMYSMQNVFDKDIDFFHTETGIVTCTG